MLPFTTHLKGPVNGDGQVAPQLSKQGFHLSRPVPGLQSAWEVAGWGFRCLAF